MSTGFNANARWEKENGLKTTAPMRDRLRELASQSGSDDYDRVVNLLLDDFASLKVIIAIQSDALKRSNEEVTK